MTVAAKPLSRAKWLAMRSKALGGTDVAAIVGLDPYRTPIDVFNLKTGKVPPEPENQMMVAGRILEPGVVTMYCARTGRKAKRTPVLVHPEHPFLMGTPDRRVWDKERPLSGLLEVKTHGAAAFEKVREEGLYPAHVVQLQWYLGLDRLVGQTLDIPNWAAWGSYAVLNRDRFDLITFDVEPDEAFFESLVDAAVAFWNDHVILNVPPPLPEIPLVTAPKVGGDAKVVDDELVVEALAVYAEAKRVADEAQSALDAAKNALKETLPEKGSYKLPGATVNYTMEPGRRTVDKAALIAHGIDPTKFERQGEPFEMFKVFLKKGPKAP